MRGQNRRSLLFCGMINLSDRASDDASLIKTPLIRLTTERVGHRFGDRVLFKRMDLSFSGGHSTAIVGANGSGKSTLVRILAGLMQPTKGSVVLSVDGREIESEHRPLSSGLVAPYLNVYQGFTPRENLQFIAQARGMGRMNTRIQEVLETVQIDTRADDAVGTFSSGMLQRVKIACALLPDPPVLFLDEPSATLDLDGVAMTRRVIEKALQDGRIVIVATNEPDEAEACEERIAIEDYQ